MEVIEGGEILSLEISIFHKYGSYSDCTANLRAESSYLRESSSMFELLSILRRAIQVIEDHEGYEAREDGLIPCLRSLLGGLRMRWVWNDRMLKFSCRWMIFLQQHKCISGFISIGYPVMSIEGFYLKFHRPNLLVCKCGGYALARDAFILDV